jgi:hypothetical protein
VTEVDSSGRIAAVVISIRRLAGRESRAWSRWLARDAARRRSRSDGAVHQACNDHDRAAIRAVLADDLVFDDHRRTGRGISSV